MSARTGMLTLVILSLAACERREARDETALETASARTAVAAEMQRYGRVLRTVNADSVSAFFADAGELIEPGMAPVRGRDSVRAFLASFVGVRVDSVGIRIDTIEVFGDHAFAWGAYFERVVPMGQPPTDQRGRFVAEWTRQGGKWLIAKFLPQPVPAPPPSPAAGPR